MFQMVIIGLFALGAVFAGRSVWTNFKDGIGAPYAQAQLEKDQQVLNQATAERDVARTERDSLKAASVVQNQAIEAANARAAKDQADAAAILAQFAKEKQAAEAKLAGLRALAGGNPKPQTCEKTLSDVDQILTDSAKRLRGTP